MTRSNRTLALLPTLICLLATEAMPYNKEASGYTTLPAFQVAVTGQGLTYIAQEGMDYLQKLAPSITIPEIDGKTDTPVGDVDYYISEIAVQSIAPTPVQVSVVTDPTDPTKSSVSMKVGFSAAVAFHWHFKESSFPHIGAHGDGTLDTFLATLEQDCYLWTDPTTHLPNFGSSNCATVIGNLEIHMSGAPSWLIDLFKSDIINKIRPILEHEICVVMVSVVQKGNAYLQSHLNVVYDITDHVEVDFGLVDDPQLVNNNVVINMDGGFYNYPNTSVPPFPRPVLPDAQPWNGKMLHIALSEFTIESAGRAAMNVGAFNESINGGNMPANFSIPLKTNDFKQIAPELPRKYPNKPMQVDIFAVGAPLIVQISNSTNLTIDASLTLSFSVATPPTLIPVFELCANLSTSGVVDVIGAETDKPAISGSFVFIKGDIGVVSSSVGHVDTALLQGAFNLFGQEYWVPKLNNVTATGLPIPTVDGVSFVSPQITYEEGYVVIQANFSV